MLAVKYTTKRTGSFQSSLLSLILFYSPGARFSKVPKTFWARKAIPKTATRLFCKAGLFICCKGNKN